jgi:hypothetical protein
VWGPVRVERHNQRGVALEEYDRGFCPNSIAPGCRWDRLGRYLSTAFLTIA